ncbi:phospholipase [Alkalibaculum sp. M08DMB]|uniref:Phospholipase C n=1 Tax=Alkalibaculum sporogenes TaxID=2655001 RepID=A0A6A7KBG4_9FIRM|nr:zinc dependent phospholipase C family protein [Alkalibaculum sporogenes]MPW26702.1 phospholipase [Alkalibaculum sporogenes]
MTILSKAYGSALRFTFAIANPLKKKIIKTECAVHKYINFQAVNILIGDKYQNEYDFFNKYLYYINEGAVWADQDFKSSNHFYNPYTDKGLYGRSNARELALKYYERSVEFVKNGNMQDGMFYFGATAHLIQDVTIPQHANIRLLDDHRQYENFVIKTYQVVEEYRAETGVYKLNDVEHYIKFNARVALKVYKHYKHIKDDENRFDRISRCILPLAERTTAGFMLSFYEGVIVN